MNLSVNPTAIKLGRTRRKKIARRGYFVFWNCSALFFLSFCVLVFSAFVTKWKSLFRLIMLGYWVYILNVTYLLSFHLEQANHSTMSLCKNYKSIVKNFSDDRMSPSFRWHSVYGPGHLLGQLPGSEYFRSNLGIKCEHCKTVCHAEKEIVRHTRYKHEGKIFKRTPNATFLKRIDTSKITKDNYDKTAEFCLLNEVKP